MAKIKVGINGAGRIGRTLIRQLFTSPSDQIEITAINNPGEPEIYAHLIKHDSIHSTFAANVNYTDKVLYINEQPIRFFTERDPSKIPWSEAGVEIVIDATGKFKTKEDLSKHIRDTVKKVVLCAPGASDIDHTIVMGINHDNYAPASHDVVSNASCTTNCLAPVVKVLNDNFGIENGFMTTVHAYTSDQRLLDHSHSDLRRARAAALSMIPTTTGAAKAIGLVIPELAGKLDGYAVRVPTPNVSMVDLTVNLKKETTTQEVNQKLKEASTEGLSGILSVSEEELVSTDYNGSTFSSIVDAPLTNMVSEKSLKLVVWYDNESGFSNRVINLTELIASKL
jgi:glyceraldehyde-3-phosphate dehydrogenase type I